MPSQNDEDKPQSSGLPVFNRLARAGSGGLAAATVGWTLAICVVGGALAGLALDKRLGTGYWTPILLLAGVAAGFIQMVRTLNDANRWEEQQRKAEQRDRVTTNRKAGGSGAESGTSVVTNTLTSLESVPSRASRIPAPPMPSFDQAGASAKSALSAALPSDVEDDLAQLRHMLHEQRSEDDEDERKMRED